MTAGDRDLVLPGLQVHVRGRGREQLPPQQDSAPFQLPRCLAGTCLSPLPGHGGGLLLWPLTVGRPLASWVCLPPSAQLSPGVLGAPSSSCHDSPPFSASVFLPTGVGACAPHILWLSRTHAQQPPCPVWWVGGGGESCPGAEGYCPPPVRPTPPLLMAVVSGTSSRGSGPFQGCPWLVGHGLGTEWRAAYPRPLPPSSAVSTWQSPTCTWRKRTYWVGAASRPVGSGCPSYSMVGVSKRTPTDLPFLLAAG